VGAGTTFTIYLPVLAESAAAEPAVVAAEVPAAADQTILIVEDDLTLRDALVDTVDLLGYRTLSAVNGREALALLAQHGEIALIMSDLVMPEMGGRELLQEVKRRGVTVPMVILSGHPLDDELASLQALGLTGWLLKPPVPEQLARLLAQALPAR
jgi:CheY-like chemotaxis protein